ncbi:MAG TPA: hypothetical protein VF861_04580 [Telluria sp.]
MKNSLTAVLVPLLLALPLAASAEEREWMPYQKLVETIKLDRFYALPAAQRDKIILYARLNPVNKAIPVADVKLTVVHAGGRAPLVLDASGRALVVPNPKWLAEGAKIWTTLPKGEKMSLGFDLSAVAPASLQWNYASVMGSLPQANAAVDKVAGAFSLFVPKMKSVIFKFEKPAQMSIRAKSGEKRYASDAKNQIRLQGDDDLLAENPQVTLSELPFETEIDTK